MQGSYSKLIGIAYEKADCWEIVKRFYDMEFGLALKNYYDGLPKDREAANNLIYTHKGEFEEVLDRKFGDIILIRLMGIESHIAVYLGENRMLHTSIHSGCIIERTDRWEKSIVGFYRVKK